MSTNRENITFQTADGKWNIGFWEFFYINTDSEDFDSEWDVEYNYSSFWYASTGHATPEKAYEAYTRNHSNPAGTSILTYEGNENECDNYAEMVQKLKTESLRK